MSDWCEIEGCDIDATLNPTDGDHYAVAIRDQLLYHRDLGSVANDGVSPRRCPFRRKNLHSDRRVFATLRVLSGRYMVYLADYASSETTVEQVDRWLLRECAWVTGLPRVGLAATKWDAYIDARSALPCRHVKYMTCYAKDMELTAQHSWQTCTHNEYISLRDRHLMAMPGLDLKAYLWMCHFGREWTSLLDKQSVVSADVWLSSRSTKVRQRYRHIWPNAVLPDKMFISMFVKFEKMGGVNKPPRAIQAYPPVYNLLLSEHLLPIEHEFYRTRRLVNGGHRLFAKQRNMKQRARDIMGIYGDSRFDDPVLINIDHSRFDSRVSRALVSLEFSLLCALSANPKLLASLLRCQSGGVGFSKGGLRYGCTARRKSGVINTGLGNSILNYCILSYVFRRVFSLHYIDGDDALVVIDRTDLAFVDFADFALCGMVTEVIVRQGLDDMRFCQCGILNLPDGPCMVREPLRALSRAAWSCSMSPPAGYTSMIGLCEARVNNGVPMLDAFFRTQIGFGDQVKINWDFVGYNAARDWACRPAEPLPISDALRVQFDSVFGIDPIRQADFESRVRRWRSRCRCESRIECVVAQFANGEG